MAEKKEAPKKEAVKKDDAVGGEKVKSGKRETKVESRWNLPLCLKFAKRFQTEVEWAQGAPSSYKAAMARGFMAECTKHMSGKTAKRKSA